MPKRPAFTEEYIMLELELLENVSYITFDYEVHLANGLKFSEDLLLLLNIHGMNNCSYPSDESFFFLFRGQEGDILVHF
jgi:hypothetical protein